MAKAMNMYFGKMRIFCLASGTKERHGQVQYFSKTNKQKKKYHNYPLDGTENVSLP